MNAVWSYVKTVAKAIASGLAALVGTLVLALDLQPADHQGVQYLTQAQWGIIVLAVLASYGITWRVPNSTGELPGEVVSTTPSPNVAQPPAAQTAAPTVFPREAVAASQQAQTPAIDPAAGK